MGGAAWLGSVRADDWSRVLVLGSLTGTPEMAAGALAWHTHVLPLHVVLSDCLPRCTAATLKRASPRAWRCHDLARVSSSLIERVTKATHRQGEGTQTPPPNGRMPRVPCKMCGVGVLWWWSLGNTVCRIQECMSLDKCTHLCTRDPTTLDSSPSQSVPISTAPSLSPVVLLSSWVRLACSRSSWK